MRRPIDSALSVVNDIVGQLVSGREVSTVEEVIATIRDFALIEFDVPSGADSDGFLFQYGEVNIGETKSRLEGPWGQGSYGVRYFSGVGVSGSFGCVTVLTETDVAGQGVLVRHRSHVTSP